MDHPKKDNNLPRVTEDVPSSRVLRNNRLPRVAQTRQRLETIAEEPTLQPDFAKGDRSFKGNETLASAAIATDRSGNERVVRLSKQSGYINRGITHRTSLL